MQQVTSTVKNAKIIIMTLHIYTHSVAGIHAILI